MQKGSAFTFLFTKAEPGSAYEKVFLNNFKEDLSYGSVQDGLDAVVQKNRYAMIEDMQITIANAEKAGVLCEVLLSIVQF